MSLTKKESVQALPTFEDTVSARKPGKSIPRIHKHGHHTRVYKMRDYAHLEQVLAFQKTTKDQQYCNEN